MTRRAMAVVAFFIAGAALAAWWFLGPGRRVAPPAPPPPAVAQAPVEAPSAPVLPSAPASAVLHPVEAIPAEDTTEVPPEGIAGAVTQLVGRAAVEHFLVLDDFPRRLAATVDNLGRDQASPSVWPVQPTPGRFKVLGTPPDLTVDPDNGLRYAPFVRFLERTDLRRAVGLYRRMYPAIQQAYADIGFPNRYFNDRFVEVIDQMIAAPVPSGTLSVRLPEAEGPVKPARPWLLYDFADPGLRSLTAGQRLMLRLGPVDELRVKARLRALRALLVAEPPAATPAASS